jgi:hypothetical protein
MRDVGHAITDGSSYTIQHIMVLRVGKETIRVDIARIEAIVLHIATTAVFFVHFDSQGNYRFQAILVSTFTRLFYFHLTIIN